MLIVTLQYIDAVAFRLRNDGEIPSTPFIFILQALYFPYSSLACNMLSNLPLIRGGVGRASGRSEEA